MKCPVCKTECGNSSSCSRCGFDQVGRYFINQADAESWMANVVIPYRNNYIEALQREIERRTKVSFRTVEKKFCLILHEQYAKLLAPNSRIANSLLCYGYVDVQAGLTYQAVGVASYSPDGYFVCPDRLDTSMKIRAESVKGVRIIPFNIDLVEPRQRQSIMEQVNVIDEIYYENKDVVACRSITELDDFRHEYYPDDLQILLFREGQKPEQIWARCEQVLQYNDEIVYFVATLLNEPFSDFGVHQGSRVRCICGEASPGERVCVAQIS